MIEGLHADVTTTELRAHLDKRVEHHLAKAAGYEKQLAGLEGLGMQSSGGSLDATRDIRNHIATHRQKAGRFAFLRDHLVEGETYRLDDGDMREVELVEGGRW